MPTNQLKQVPILGPILAGPESVDTTPAEAAAQGYDRDAAWLEAERNRVKHGGGVQANPQFIDPLRDRQTGALDLLTSAATGAQPSEAELTAQRVAATGAARQFGIASALQGRSPGAALAAGEAGAAQVQGDAIAQGAQLRAKEMSDARTQLVNGLIGVRGQEQDLSKTNAQLNLEQQNMLLAARLREQGYSEDMIKVLLDARAKDAASQNAYAGGILGGGASVAAALA